MMEQGQREREIDTRMKEILREMEPARQARKPEDLDELNLELEELLEEADEIDASRITTPRTYRAAALQLLRQMLGNQR